MDAADKPSVLVVDDFPVNTLLLESILAKEGFVVYQAGSGEEARAFLETQSVDLILMDIMMPGESGFETCARLKAQSRTAQIPIIFISALEDVENKVRGLTIGGADYVSKPFEKLEVLARCRLQIRMNRAYQALLENQRQKLLQVRQAQQDLLVRPEDFPEGRFALVFRPMQEAGGDFYDAFPLGEGLAGYFVADVAGHDLGTSLWTGALKASLRQNAGPLFRPQETLLYLNDLLRPLFRDGQHLTACFAHLNRNRNLLTYLSAGHPPGIFQTAQGACSLLEASGDILGAFPNVVLEPLERTVAPGDRFFLFSDGLLEGFGPQKRRRSAELERARGLIEGRKGQPLQTVVQALADSLGGSGPPQDDLVILGVEV